MSQPERWLHHTVAANEYSLTHTHTQKDMTSACLIKMESEVDEVIHIGGKEREGERERDSNKPLWPRLHTPRCHRPLLRPSRD